MVYATFHYEMKSIQSVMADISQNADNELFIEGDPDDAERLVSEVYLSL